MQVYDQVKYEHKMPIRKISLKRSIPIIGVEIFISEDFMCLNKDKPMVKIQYPELPFL
jgi:hypothetical protein